MPNIHLLGVFSLDQNQVNPFRYWLAAAGGVEKVVRDQFQLWWSATQKDALVEPRDLQSALDKIASGSAEAKLIAGKLQYLPSE